jgi:DNA repair exonuclease SbcCD ATPase subunit
MVARELSELTRVNQIFEAVRNANRIRTNAQSTLKLRSADLDAVTSAVRTFQGLSGQLKAFSYVQVLDERRRDLLERLARLDKAIQTLSMAEFALVGYESVQVPDGRPLADLKDRYVALRHAAMAVVTRDSQAQTAARQHVTALTEVKDAQSALAALLTEVKVCPTCGQELHEDG